MCILVRGAQTVAPDGLWKPTAAGATGLSWGGALRLTRQRSYVKLVEKSGDLGGFLLTNVPRRLVHFETLLVH